MSHQTHTSAAHSKVTMLKLRNFHFTDDLVNAINDFADLHPSE